MRAYFCRAVYESFLPCEAAGRFATSLLMEASDFVLADNAIEARLRFVDWHQNRIAPAAVMVEERFDVDPVVLHTLTWGRDPKPVGDMALFDYWAWLGSVDSVAA